MTLFFSAMVRIVERASDSVIGGCRLSGWEERMLAGMVDDTRESRESKPMDWSMRLASLSLGPTNFDRVVDGHGLGVLESRAHVGGE